MLHISYNSQETKPHSPEVTETNTMLDSFQPILPNSQESQDLRSFEGERFLPNSQQTYYKPDPSLVTFSVPEYKHLLIFTLTIHIIQKFVKI
jgi:hypothetical protein